MNNVTWLLGRARSASLALVGSIAARIAGHIAGIAVLAVPAWILGTVAIEVRDGKSVNVTTLVLLAVTVLVLAVAKAWLRYVEQFLGHYAAFRLLGELRIWMMDRLFPLAPGVTNTVGVARIHTIAIRDIGRIEVFFAHTIAPAMTAVVIPIVAMICAWYLVGTLPALVLGIVMAIGVVVPFVGRRRGSALSQELLAARTALSHHVADTVRLRDTICSYQAETQRIQQVDTYSHRLGDALEGSARWAGVRSAMSSVRIWGGIFAVFLSTVPRLSVDPSMLSAVLASVALVPATVPALETIERLAASLSAGLAATSRVRALAQTTACVVEADNPIPIPEGPVEIQFQHATFTYPGAKRPAIADVTLSCPAGSIVGLAGATGSGKSTLIRLVQRHWDVDEGAVTIIGVDLRNVAQSQLHRRVIVVDQDPFILDASIKDNVRLGYPDAPDELVDKVLAFAELGPIDAVEGTANCQSCDKQSTLDLTRPIGRRGKTLSGGQRQRVAIARALLRAHAAPGGVVGALLVFDESTSYQDPLTQARLMARIRGLGCGVVVCAHRLVTLKCADHILVMEEGHVVERGSYEDLATAGGCFSRLLHGQQAG